MNQLNASQEPGILSGFLLTLHYILISNGEAPYLRKGLSYSRCGSTTLDLVSFSPSVETSRPRCTRHSILEVWSFPETGVMAAPFQRFKSSRDWDGLERVSHRVASILSYKNSLGICNHVQMFNLPFTRLRIMQVAHPFIKTDREGLRRGIPSNSLKLESGLRKEGSFIQP